MIAYIYRPKRRRNGKVVYARLYRARVRFPGEHRMRDIPLEVTEPRSADQKLQQMFTGVKSPFVPLCHNGSKVAKWSERQDLNLRRLGPKPSALPG